MDRIEQGEHMADKRYSTREQAVFIFNAIPAIRCLDSVKALMDITECPANDDEVAKRDAAVMSAIWDIRYGNSDNDELVELLSNEYAGPPATKAYLHDRGLTPFSDDGIAWSLSARMGDDERCASVHSPLFYSNAFAHAITYFITRGWGLSATHVQSGRRGWEFEQSHNAYDCSILIAVLDVLFEREIITREQHSSACGDIIDLKGRHPRSYSLWSNRFAEELAPLMAKAAL